MPDEEPAREREDGIRPEQIFGAEITRRGFLKRSLGGTIALGAAGLLPAGCAKYPAAPEGLRVLDSKEYAILNAAAAIYVGGGPASEGLDVAAFSDGVLSRLPEWVQKQVKQALALFEFGPLLFAFTPKPFTALDPGAQRAYVDGWAQSGIAFRRTVHWALRQLCLGGYYMQSGAWKVIHYDGPWIGRMAIPAAAQRFPLPEGSVKR